MTEAQKTDQENNTDCTWTSLLFLVTAGSIIYPLLGTVMGVALLAIHGESIEFLMVLFSWRTYLSGFFIAGIPGFFVSCLLIWLIADTYSVPPKRKASRYAALSFSLGFGVPFLCYTLLTGWIGVEWFFMLLIAGSISGYLTGYVLRNFYNSQLQV